MSAENGMCWSETGSGIGESVSTPLPRNPRRLRTYISGSESDASDMFSVL